MSPEKTKGYASPREEDNCTFFDAEALIANIEFLGFGKPTVYVKNDANPFETFFNDHVKGDKNTPVYIYGFFQARPDATFTFAQLVETQKSGIAFDLYVALMNAIQTGITNPQHQYNFMNQGKRADDQKNLLQSYKLPAVPKPVK